MIRGAWRCEVPVVLTDDPDGLPIEETFCRRCHATVDPHPNALCGRCDHLVEFHGRDMTGCGKFTSSGWCPCRRAFGRDHPDHVRYA